MTRTPAIACLWSNPYDGRVFGLLVVLFIVLPVLEIYVIIQIGDVIGGWETIGLVILVSVVGAWMVRREGLSLIRRVQGQLVQGSVPTKELVDGLLVAFAGALMLTPGFITDGVGLLCLFPPTRLPIRTALIRRFRDRTVITSFGGGGPQQRGRVYDVGEADYDKPGHDKPDSDPPSLT